MDLDRSVSEVLGARFGGGGAIGREPIGSQLEDKQRKENRAARVVDSTSKWTIRESNLVFFILLHC